MKNIFIILLFCFISSVLCYPQQDDSLLYKNYYDTKIEKRDFNYAKWQKIKRNLDYKEEATKDYNYNLGCNRFKGDISNPFEKINLKLIAYILVYAILIYLIIKLIKYSIADNKIKKPAPSSLIENTVLTDESIINSDIDYLIQEAIEKKNNKLLIRLYYLKILKTLKEKNIIEWSKDKSNTQYVMMLMNHQYFQTFRIATSVFEKIWYGNTEPTPSEYEIIMSHFKNFVNQAKDTNE